MKTIKKVALVFVIMISGIAARLVFSYLEVPTCRFPGIDRVSEPRMAPEEKELMREMVVWLSANALPGFSRDDSTGS